MCCSKGDCASQLRHLGCGMSQACEQQVVKLAPSTNMF